MRVNRGGDVVRGGYYWNLEKWDATFVEGREGVLPGSPREPYRRIPVLLLLVAAPVMGALFVMFLPFIGVVLLLQHIGRASLMSAGDVLERTLARIGSGSRPALFAGRTLGHRPRGGAAARRNQI